MYHTLTSREPAGLRSQRQFLTRNMDEARERIAEVLQPHRLEPGKGTGDTECFLDHLPLVDAGVGAIRFGAARVDVTEIADYYLFLATRTGSAVIRVDGEEHCIDPHHGVIIAPGERMVGHFSADCEQFFVRIGQRAITAHLGRGQIRFRRAVNLADARIYPWLALLQTMACEPQAYQQMQAHGALMADYERLLVGLLLAGQDYQQPHRRAVGAVPGCVKRAEDFIHAMFSEQIALENIAQAARVPTRTLLESFRRFRDISPIRFLRDVRLDHARELLRNGEVATTAEAAMNAGIMHLGRFSRDYADRFGERPSETLRGRVRYAGAMRHFSAMSGQAMMQDARSG